MKVTKVEKAIPTITIELDEYELRNLHIAIGLVPYGEFERMKRSLYGNAHSQQILNGLHNSLETAVKRINE